MPPGPSCISRSIYACSDLAVCVRRPGRASLVGGKAQQVEWRVRLAGPDTTCTFGPTTSGTPSSTPPPRRAPRSARAALTAASAGRSYGRTSVAQLPPAGHPDASGALSLVDDEGAVLPTPQGLQNLLHDPAVRIG